jgi:glutamate racemase
VSSDLPIGVFDSGVGGLTVLRALRERLPAESLVYLGDTARVPYGTKSVESVVRYAIQATDHLVARGVKLLVIACNTASAVSLEPLESRFAPLPVVGVVEPGAAAAVATGARRHLVLATESTVRRHAYARAIQALDPDARVDELACSLLVALAEEGWTEGPIPEAVAHRYLDAATGRGAFSPEPETVVLGCTHFPLLAGAVRAAVGPGPVIVDSATTTAAQVADLLARLDLGTPRMDRGALTLLATDGPERFAVVGSRFLGESIRPADIEVVDL